MTGNYERAKKRPGRIRAGGVCLTAFLIVFLAVLASHGCGRIPGEPITKSGFLLNTFVSVTIYDSRDQQLLENSLKLCREYEQLFSRTIESSEVSRINNREPGESQVEVSPSTAELIGKGLEYSALSGGAFDITIYPVSSLWDFTAGNPAVPDREKLEAGAGSVDYRKVSVEGNRISFASPDTRIELGAVAKGYIADKIKEYLESEGVKSALINLGGNVLCVGERPDKTPFKIGLQKPFRDRNETIAVLMIDDQSMVTSGIYERCFEQDGKFYHHILDPDTGYPYDNGLLSVTIVSPESVDGDGLSTACFSLGLEKGMELVDSMPQVYGYFITEDYQIHYSEGAEGLLECNSSGRSARLPR